VSTTLFENQRWSRLRGETSCTRWTNRRNTSMQTCRVRWRLLRPTKLHDCYYNLFDPCPRLNSMFLI